METIKNIEYAGKIHFIGVLGVSMSGLAKYCLGKGIRVSGSDRAYSAEAENLSSLGAEICIGHRAENVNGASLAVYSSAVSESNAEIIAAREQGIPLIKRSAFLGGILQGYKRSIAVSGSHGKTTATAMLWEIFERAGKNPAVFLGGNYGVRGNFREGDGDFAIAEACEYKKNFLDIKPYVAVILNIDNDHLDSFGSFDREISAFGEFAEGRISVVNADDANCEKISLVSVTFGIINPAMFSARKIKRGGRGYNFDLYAYGRKQGRINLKTAGRHNVYNALAAAAAAQISGISFEAVKKGLESFCGVNRRNEYVGEIKGKAAYADYAHHPSELAAVLSSYIESGIKPAVIFQPHTYSRTRILMDDFVFALKESEPCVIYKTFPAREEYDAAGDGVALAEKINASGGKAVYAADEKTLYGMLGKFKNADCFLFLGAGNIYETALSFAKQKK